MNARFDTPILLIVFNRPDITQKLFNTIRLIKPKFLFIAADGPRHDHPDDKLLCQETREIFSRIDWNCEVKTLFRDSNIACGLAVSSAISWFFEHVDEGIILEDDCLPDPSFFPYCSELLRRYKEDNSIYVISGTSLYKTIEQNIQSYFFSHYTITWGWASWKRAWEHFNHDILDIDNSFYSGALDHVFQSPQEKKYWKSKFKESISQKKKIWDYQWFYAIWKNRGIGIAPSVNLVTNIGFREKSSHQFLKDTFREPPISGSILFPLKHPNKEINRVADHYIYKNAFSYSLSRIFRLIKENGVLTITKYIINKLLKTILKRVYY